MLTGLVEPTEGRVSTWGVDVTGGQCRFRSRSATCRKSRTSIRSSRAANTWIWWPGCGISPSGPCAPEKHALLERFGLAEAAEQSIGAYSKGMKQKIAVDCRPAARPGTAHSRRTRVGPRRRSILLLRHSSGSSPSGAARSCTALTSSRTSSGCARASSSSAPAASSSTEMWTASGRSRRRDPSKKPSPRSPRSSRTHLRRRSQTSSRTMRRRLLVRHFSTSSSKTTSPPTWIVTSFSPWRPPASSPSRSSPRYS